MKKYIVLEKTVGQTPLQCIEIYRDNRPELTKVPLAYAGRLDPMASGKLLVLIGDECKHQDKYHRLDKEYEFEVLLGAKSDTGDVLGLINTYPSTRLDIAFVKCSLKDICKKLTGKIELPYPHYSSKTVKGKSLHTWALEERIDEIEIPTKKSEIYKLNLIESFTISKDRLYESVSAKIETIPHVTEESKKLGNDFRRPLVRESWKTFHDSFTTSDSFLIIKFRCIASSGTYMRTLSEIIGKELGTCGLAYSIHRTKIGMYQHLPFNLRFWKEQF